MTKTKPFKIIISTIFTLSLVFSTLFFQATPVSAAYETNFDVFSNAVYLVNRETGRVLYKKNENAKIFPASVTKIMTGILILENIENLDTEMITVTKEALDPLNALPYGISHAGLRLGEVFTAKDLLFCIMIASASDAANTIAISIGGSISGFADMMNEKAKELGMTSTNFVNPHGLHEDEHYTTAEDLYKLTDYALNFLHSQTLMEVASSTNHTFTTNLRPNPDKNYIATTNFLQNKGSPVYNPLVSGLKTGTTTEAGGCLVSTAKKGDYSYVLILMGSPLENSEGETYNPRVSFTETTKFYNWAFENFSIKTIIDKKGLAAEVPIKMSSKTDFLQLRIENDYKEIIPNNYGEDSVLKDFKLPSYVNAPVEEGDFIGTMDIVLSGEVIGSINLYANETITRSSSYYALEIVKESLKSSQFHLAIFLVVLAILIFILAMVVINKKNKARKSRRSFSGISRR